MPATRLTSEQGQMLENHGVEEGFSDHLIRFALNSGLFEEIADQVRASTDTATKLGLHYTNIEAGHKHNEEDTPLK
jgi:hypothetical protein